MINQKYKKPESKDGRFSMHLPADITSDISIICRIKNIPITRYVNDTLKKAVEIDIEKLREVSKYE